MSSAEPVLTGQSLHKRFSIGGVVVNALAGVDIEAHAGQMTMLLGPSGSGKTTLLHVLSGLERPDQGSVHAGDRSLYDLSDITLSRLRSREFGFIFQAYNLLPNLTALENVQIPLRVNGRSNARPLAMEMLERVGLGKRAHHRPGQMSGGEQQRVAVARALVMNPRIVFADEPTGNLDSASSSEVMSIMHSLVKEQGTACLLVTHNAELAEMADRVVHLRDGLIVEVSAGGSDHSC